MNDFINSFFNPIDSTKSIIAKGTLVSFQYSQWKNDPNPLVILTNYSPGIKIKGINLHYLTYPSIMNLVNISKENPMFSYKDIAQNNILKSAFRSYTWTGVQRLKQLNTDRLTKIIDSNRNFDPGQNEAIRNNVQSQLNQTSNINQNYYNKDYNLKGNN